LKDLTLIISASRRTDIPAFFAPWFINRIRAGFCTVPNPFNNKHVSTVSLLVEDVEVIVIWTRNPRPLFPYLGELTQRGYKFYFQYTILDNPHPIDPGSPPLKSSIQTFKELSNLIGSDRVIWRYDPIVFSSQTNISFHVKAYEKISSALSGFTHRSVISIMDRYAKADNRLKQLFGQGYQLMSAQDVQASLYQLVPSLVQIASRSQMEIVSCAEQIDLSVFGVRAGKCIDDNYIQKVFGLVVESKKDSSQRKECGCVVSKDIGMYDSCLFGCQYCYATHSFNRARLNHEGHDPQSPSLLGRYEPDLQVQCSKTLSNNNTTQLNLFKEDE
jgi:hypothetical protein